MSLLALYNLLLFLRLNCLHHCCYFNPSLCCLSPLFSFVSCRHFKGMLLVEILPGKGLISIFFIVTHKQGSLQTKSDTVLYMQYGAVLHSH